jgi:Holliday junction resolvase RusA-like endonuclease
MHKLNIKPLSVNDLWRGRRFKTDEYKVYERSIFYQVQQLKNVIQIPGCKQIVFVVRFGFSSRGSDVSNPIKAIEDILQKSLGLNDNKTYMLIAEKTIVPKGEEWFEFDYFFYNENLFTEILKLLKK